MFEAMLDPRFDVKIVGMRVVRLQALLGVVSIMNDLNDVYPNDPMATDLKENTDDEAAMTTAQEHHQFCKNKVGEFVAIRALARPLKPDETRARVRATAMDTISSLDAELPAKLGLLISL